MKLTKAQQKVILKSLESNMDQLRSYRDEAVSMPALVEEAINDRVDELNFTHTDVRDAEIKGI